MNESKREILGYLVKGASLREVLNLLTCLVKGHDLEEELIDPTEGKSELFCNRCGWSETIYR